MRSNCSAHVYQCFFVSSYLLFLYSRLLVCLCACHCFACVCLWVCFLTSVFTSDDFLQDEDFVIDKDDGGSPTDDSGEEESDASESGDEKEANHFYCHFICSVFKRIMIRFYLVTHIK